MSDTSCDFPVLHDYNVQLHPYYKERVCLLYYNLTRKNTKKDIQDVENILSELLASLRKHTGLEYVCYLNVLYKMIGHTRDIFHGKGEHEISYMMIYVWYKYYPVMALFCLHRFLLPIHDELPYGSWRDMKYFCEYVRLRSPLGINDPLIEISVELTNKTLRKDFILWKHVRNEKVSRIRSHLSMVSKWIPREHKKFDWLYDKLVIQWFSEYSPHILNSFTTYEGYYKALSKCKMNYRKIISNLNTLIDTTEIKMTAKEWDTIQPANIPQNCLMKKKRLFIRNENQRNNLRDNGHIEKYECVTSVENHFIYKSYFGGIYDPAREHSKYIPFSPDFSYFVKEALEIVDALHIDTSQYNHLNYENKICILNTQWSQMSGIIGYKNLENYIPILDLSFLSDKNQTSSFYAALGFGCLIAERSSLGKRILVADQNPLWIDLTDCNGFFESIQKIKRSIDNLIFTSVHLFNALDLFIHSFDQANTSCSNIRSTTFVLLQTTSSSSYSGMHQKIIDYFFAKGRESSRKTPFPCPTIVYWNLCQEFFDKLPCPLHYTNCVLFSGLAPHLLRSIYKIRKKDSYEILCTLLNQSRYDVLEKHLYKMRNEFSDTFGNH
jgi:hypothetical protein